MRINSDIDWHRRLLLCGLKAMNWVSEKSIVCWMMSRWTSLESFTNLLNWCEKSLVSSLSSCFFTSIFDVWWRRWEWRLKRRRKLSIWNVSRSDSRQTKCDFEDERWVSSAGRPKMFNLKQIRTFLVKLLCIWSNLFSIFSICTFAYVKHIAEHKLVIQIWRWKIVNLMQKLRLDSFQFVCRHQLFLAVYLATIFGIRFRYDYPIATLNRFCEIIVYSKSAHIELTQQWKQNEIRCCISNRIEF